MNILANSEYFQETVQLAVKMTLQSFIDVGVDVITNDTFLSVCKTAATVYWNHNHHNLTNANNMNQEEPQKRVYFHRADGVVMSCPFQHGQEIPHQDLMGRSIVKIEIK